MKILTALSLTVCLAAAAAVADLLKVGDMAPDFQLTGSDGKTYKLSSFKGKQAVVLAWFPKAFTGGCTAECSSLRDTGKELRKFDVAYFTASCDEPATNKAFADSLKLDYPILSDPSAQAARAYGVLVADRKVARRVTFFIGKDGKVLFIEDPVKPQSAGSDVVGRLKALGIAEKNP